MRPVRGKGTWRRPRLRGKDRRGRGGGRGRDWRCCTRCFQRPLRVWVSALVMEAVRSSETSVDSHLSTRRYNPEDSHLHNKQSSSAYCCGVLKVTSKGLRKLHVKTSTFKITSECNATTFMSYSNNCSCGNLWTCTEHDTNTSWRKLLTLNKWQP
jgi:hypothetical protein